MKCLCSLIPRLNVRLSATLFVAWIVFGAHQFHCYGQNDLTNIPVPDPVAELAAMKLDPAVEVNLFASDPMVSKPIHSNFGYDGKLWIATSSIYPQLAPGEIADDKIVVLEDIDHDGVADSSTVFADGLLIPTGVLPDLPSDKGVGCYVAASTQLLYFLDTDRDGVSDHRRVVLSGFGTEDTHHLLHTLRWGPDGCIYMNQSIYIHSHVETPYGTQSLDGGGVWRFNPRSMRLDVVCKGFVNPWGHVFDGDGQSFITDGAYNEGINHIFPGSVFATSPGEERWLSGMNPGSPKHCGLEILHDQSLPESYFDHMISSDFRAHRVNRFSVVKTDQGYRSVQQSDLIRSEHPAFRPIDTKLGPDGCLYISDWYNPIIQHGEVDFRDLRRDRTHGRIWRVRWKDASAMARSYSRSVTEQSVEELMHSLVETNSTQASWAKLEIARRDATEVNRLLDEKVASIDRSMARNVWLRLRCDVEAHRDFIREASIEALYSSDNANDRASAIRFYLNYKIDRHLYTHANYISEKASTDIQFLRRGIQDSDWLVRLEALAALRKINMQYSISTALEVLNHPMSSELDFALWKLLREDEANAIAMLADDIQKTRELLDAQTLNRWSYVMKSIKSSEWSPAIVDALLADKIPLSASTELSLQILELASSRTDDKQVGRLLAWIASRIDSSSNPKDPMVADMSIEKIDQTTKGLEALRLGTEKSKIKPANVSEILPKFLMITQATSVDANQRLRLQEIVARAAGQWSVGSLQPWLEESLQDESILASSSPGGNDLVSTIINSLGALGGEQSTDKLLSLALDSGRSPRVRAATISVIAKYDLAIAAKACLESIAASEGTPFEESLYGFISIVNRKNGPEAVLATLPQVLQIPSPIASAMLSAMQSSGISRADLRAEIQRLGKIETRAWKYSVELLEDVQQRLVTTADPMRGESIYRRSSLQCIRCHAIGSGGNNIGPNLQSIGGSSQVDYILQSLIEPDAKLKEGFQTTVVMTDDDQVITGLVKSRSADQLQLLTGEGKLVTIATEMIAEEKEGKSLMPAGLVDALSIEELVDVVSFLSQLGRSDSYSVSTEPWIRNWQYLADSPEGQKLLNRTSIDSIASDSDALLWENISTMVSGKLPIQELHAMKPHRDIDPFVSVRVTLDCQQAGEIRLKFSDPADGEVQAWFDSQRWAEPSKLARHCSVGTHRLVLAITRSRVEQLGIQVESVVSDQGNPTPIVVPIALNHSRHPPIPTRNPISMPTIRLVSSQQPIEWLKPNDRIAWLGGRYWEQMSEHGDLEMMLTIRRPDYRMRFRNVSWSGDDVEGRARAAFGKTEDGYRRRLADLKAAAPNIVLVGYGQSEAIDTRWTIDRFEKGYLRLIGDLRSNGYRPILVMPPTLPTNVSFPINVASINERILEIQSVLFKLAKKAELATIDHPPISPEMTDDGLTINEAGYRLLAKEWADLLAPQRETVQLPTAIAIDSKQLTIRVDGAKGWSFENLEQQGEFLSWDEKFSAFPSVDLNKKLMPITWSIRGLTNDVNYDLILDDKLVVSATGLEWKYGFDVFKNGVTARRLSLHRKIIEKEQAFFHQYRPQNETYLFLFRKHEQGKNAIETQQFEKQVESLERDIDSLVQSGVHHWKLIRR